MSERRMIGSFFMDQLKGENALVHPMLPLQIKSTSRTVLFDSAARYTQETIIALASYAGCLTCSDYLYRI